MRDPIVVERRPASTIRAVAPGRVNLIGDHTDHTGGWVLPMAIDLATTIDAVATDEPVIELRSDRADADVRLALPVDGGGEEDDAAGGSEPVGWGRYVAAAAAELGVTTGIRGQVTSTVPVGGGLSSSASLLVAVVLALGAEPSDPLALARLCQRAEQRAVGVPCGIMDPLASLAGVEGSALLIDTTTGEVDPVPLPDDVEVVIVDSGVARTLEGSAYGDRRERCEAAARAVGGLRDADLAAVEAIDDPLVRAAGRHVVSENARVRAAAAALRRGDVDEVGRLMVESHASLRDDLDVSTPEIDALVDRLVQLPGVAGARLTGAGFGGWVVALCTPGAIADGLVVRPSAGASVSDGPASA